jgi:hypothetical protein
MESTGGFLSKSNIKDHTMDKNTLFSSFSKWIAPINRKKLDDYVEKTGQDRYVKKLTTGLIFFFFYMPTLKRGTVFVRLRMMRCRKNSSRSWD